MLAAIGLLAAKIAALAAHRQCISRRAAEDIVFGNRKGDPLRESKLLTNVLQAAAEADGLGPVTWHQVRHMHSSLLNDLKVPVKIMGNGPALSAT